jgi:small GTP-binding protein
MTNERVIELIGRTSGNFLDLSNYRLTQLSPEITELKNLTKLSLSGNKLTQLPPEIGELENLEELDLSYNLLIQLPPEIEKLKNLKILNLTRNQLTQLPPEIGELKNLNYFYLSCNQLTQLPPEIGKLKNLRAFYLSSNQLIQLPTEIGELKNLRALNLSDNSLTSPPPEIVSMGAVQVVTYLKQLKESTENNEAKLILVGNGGVGKTCLANWLIKNKFVEDKITEGINISEWVTSSPSRDSKIKLNIWDFGGQEIYHATHQFFLTTRSVYLLVWNARKTKDYDTIYYWLHTIEAFGEDSPIILVMSKMNESDDDLNLEYIKSKFNIADYLKIDSIDGTGIHRLKEKISRTAWNLPLMRSRFPNSYYRVREKLENLGRNWITEDELYKICISERLDDKNISLLDRYLHELGVILHFKDRIGLKNIVILKPKWATEAFYSILSTKSVRDREGVLLHRELEQIWDKETYPPEIYPQLMELMNKFELAYELSDKSKYLVPELLPPYAFDLIWDEKDNLRFYYCYEYFLPPGIITRFIVRMHQDIEKKENGLPLCWREGVVLKLQNSLALVKMNPDEKQIEIRIKGDNKREALVVICHYLDQINSDIKKIRISKEVPCNCSENCPQRYSYEKLREAERINIEDFRCIQSFKQISISSLLDGYKEREERLKERDEIYGKPIVIINQPQAHSESNSIAKTEQKTNVTVDINIDIKIDLPLIQTEFDDLKDELESLNPKLDSDLDKIQDSLDELSPNSDKEKLVKPLNKLNRFLIKLSDPDSDYNKIIIGTKKGIEYAQKLGRTYNKFAQWLAMPQVPDLFLGK